MICNRTPLFAQIDSINNLVIKFSLESSVALNYCEYKVETIRLNATVEVSLVKSVSSLTRIKLSIRQRLTKRLFLYAFSEN